MKRSVNLLSDSDPRLLNRDMNAISKSRQIRSAEADFNGYLDFLEEASSIFGFKKKRADSFKMNGDPPLL